MTAVTARAVGVRGSHCDSPDSCLPHLTCLNFTCSCPQSSCPGDRECLCLNTRTAPPQLTDTARTHWPTVVLGSILVFAALTTLITCLAHTIAKKFTKSVHKPEPLPEISTLGQAYGTGTLFCTPSPSGTPITTPWSTPLPPPRGNFFNRKGSCPTSFYRCHQNTDFGSANDCSLYAPFLVHTALPVVSCAIAPVTGKTSNHSETESLKYSDYQMFNNHKQGFTRRSTMSELPSLGLHRDLPVRFSSQADLGSGMTGSTSSNERGFSNGSSNSTFVGDRRSRDRPVPSTLEIASPKLTSISSSDTFLTANTSTPQDNSKYSFHSVMDSSLDSYLTLTSLSPNPSPPTLFPEPSALNTIDSPHRYSHLFNGNHPPKSILKKEAYSLPYYAAQSPLDLRDTAATSDNSYMARSYVGEMECHSPLLLGSENNNLLPERSVASKKEIVIEPCDRERLENIKRMISEKIVNSLASNPPNGYRFHNINNNMNNYARNYREENGAAGLGTQSLSNDFTNILETHL